MSMIDDIKDNMRASNQTFDQDNVRQQGLYLGLQCEELAEKLAAVFGRKNYYIVWLDALATELKRGDHDYLIKPASRMEMLDGDIDLIVVSIGAALSQGADVDGAWKEVYQSNVSKRNPETGMIDRDKDGKWIKAATYRKPNLLPFIIHSKEEQE